METDIQIGFAPVLTPTLEEFVSPMFLPSLTARFSADFGMVKVIPPEGWTWYQPAEYKKKLEGLAIKKAIEQNVQGTPGYWQCKNIAQPELSFSKYKDRAISNSARVSSMTLPQKQSLFWKTLPYSPSLYAADIPCSLMLHPPALKPYNLSQFDSLLKHAIPTQIPGVTTPYLYIGEWKTLFCWHVQDLGLAAVNVLHEGQSKIWYCLASESAVILELEGKSKFAEQYRRCKEFMKHKSTIINPYKLKRKYPELKISKMEHKAGEMVFVFSGAYHCGFNCGFNVAEAINYATIDWFQHLKKQVPCRCSKNSVKADPRILYQNLLASQIISQLSSTAQFIKFKEWIEELGEYQQDDVSQKQIQKLIIKKIKKKMIKKEQQKSKKDRKTIKPKADKKEKLTKQMKKEMGKSMQGKSMHQHNIEETAKLNRPIGQMQNISNFNYQIDQKYNHSHNTSMSSLTKQSSPIGKSMAEMHQELPEDSASSQLILPQFALKVSLHSQIQCDICQIWRLVSKRISKLYEGQGEQFRFTCSQIGKECFKLYPQQQQLRNGMIYIN